MCDTSEGRMHWFCKLFGHKHVGHDICTVWFQEMFCLRCFRNSVSREGDGAVICKVLGHHCKHTIDGDFSSRTYAGPVCWWCHAKVAGA